MVNIFGGFSVCINKRLLSEGLALPYMTTDSEYEKLAKEAKSKRKGIYRNPDNIAPSEWRKLQKNKKKPQ
ncbi:MAG: hypothetical protein ABGY11_04425 [Candidatus Thioglobus sp.]